MEPQNTQTAELTQAMDQFRVWFEQERAKGLVDVKFFVGNTSSNSATIEKAIFEFNHSNRMIEAGIIESHLETLSC